MALALTRSPGQAVLFTGAVTSRLEVLSVYRYHVVLDVDGKRVDLRAGAPLTMVGLGECPPLTASAQQVADATPVIRLDLADINGRQARIAITAPPSVHVLREELQLRHSVRRGRTGDYECSCGATWDYRDGVEHP